MLNFKDIFCAKRTAKNGYFSRFVRIRFSPEFFSLVTSKKIDFFHTNQKGAHEGTLLVCLDSVMHRSKVLFTFQEKINLPSCVQRW